MCSTSDHPKGPETSGSASGGRKRRVTATEERISQRQQSQDPSEVLNDAEQRAQIPSVWDPASEPEIPSLVQPHEIAPDFDQYAYDLGLVLAPFWPTSPTSPPLHGLDTTGDANGARKSAFPTDLPTPRLSDVDLSHGGFQPLDLGQTADAGTFASVSPSEPMVLPPSRLAHDLFLRKGPSDSKFIGMGSIGSTVSECLRYSVSTHGRSMESTILDHLVRGIRHVDELAVSTDFRIPPLPEVGFAERGVQAYYDFLHLLYPVLSVEFQNEWRQLYDNSSYTHSPATYARFHLVVAVGNLISPLCSDSGTQETAQRLQEQAWSLIDRVMASPYIESLQVMLLHTIFLLYSGKTGIAWVTCGMAVRVAQSLGLHQHTPLQLTLSAEHLSLRSRLWSVAYTLDAFLSLSEGRPSAITGLPNLGSSHRFSEQQLSPLATNSPAINIHDWHVGLAVIANEVVTLLKNVESLAGTLARITEIDARLLAWKVSIPMEFRPDQQILADDPLYCLVAMLHLKYHNLMRTIHWISLTLSNEDRGGNFSRLSARVRSSGSICLNSARSIIEVLNDSSSRRIAGSLGGFIVPYCMAAISIFYRQILKEPTRYSARTNLEHMRNGTLHITGLLEGSGPRPHFRALFEDMLQVAENAVTGASGRPVLPLQ